MSGKAVVQAMNPNQATKAVSTTLCGRGLVLDSGGSGNEGGAGGLGLASRVQVPSYRVGIGPVGEDLSSILLGGKRFYTASMETTPAEILAPVISIEPDNITTLSAPAVKTLFAEVSCTM